MLALILAIGAFAGVIAGLLGVGGGIVLVPAFFFAFDGLGYATPDLMQICLATSLATIVVTSVRSVLAHHRRGAVDWDILRGWGGGAALGAILGVVAATGLRGGILMAIFGVLGLAVGLYMAFGDSEWRLGDRMPAGRARAVGAPILGFLSVLMGIGGGSFGVPLMSLYNVPIHRAVATAAGFGVMIAVPSVLGFLLVASGGPDRPPFTVGQVNLAAFVAVIAAHVLFTRHVLGYQIRLAGQAPRAARFAGVNPGRMIFLCLGISGALAGMAGLFEVSGPSGQIGIDFNVGYGFTAIIVAFLGRLNPLGILAAGLLMALTYIGGELAQLMLGVPAPAIQAFQGMLLFFLLALDVLANYRVAWRRGAAA